MINSVGTGYTLKSTPLAAAPAVLRAEAPTVTFQDQVSLGPVPVQVQVQQQDFQVAPQPAPAPMAPVLAPTPVNLLMEAAPAGPTFPLLDSQGLTLNQLGSHRGPKEQLGNLSQALRSGQPAPARGYLLEGNSGAGKTTLARALAGELHQAGIPVLSANGSEFGTVAGNGLDHARQLFDEAARRAGESPSKTAVIFVDECEAALRARSTETSTAAAEGNQLMTGFVNLATQAQQRNDVQLVLIGATSVKNAVDLEALQLFPVNVPVNAPSDRNERYDVLQSLTAKGTYALGTDKEEILRDLAACTPGASPAKLKNLLDTGSRISVSRGAQQLSRADLRDARLELSFGPAQPVNTEEWMFRLTVAHELSHAVTRHVFSRLAQEDKRPDREPQKIDCITFMPRGTANAAVYLQAAHNPAITLDTLVADVTTYYGGKAAEYQFGQAHESAGPGNDLRSATNLVQQAVRNYGMQGSLLTSNTGDKSPSAEVAALEQRLSDTCDTMARSMVNYYRDFIGEMAGDITARRHDPNSLTIDGRDFEAAITAWEDASPERKQQVDRLQDYVRRTVDGLRARQGQVFDPVSNGMVEMRS